MLIDNYSQATDVGLVRENNEDAVLSRPESGLWLVADGMGGHAAGEVASQITSETIYQCIQSGQSLEESILSSHQAIHQAVQEGEGRDGMGSTVVALQSIGSKYHVSWVGDSRAYLYTRLDNLQSISIDHSYVQMLHQSGMITAEEMQTHPDKNIITQCLGSNEEEAISVDTVEGVWKEGDVILLCSDGLTDIVTDQAISHILKESASLEMATQALIAEALKNGGKDNVSVILVGAPPEILNAASSLFSPINKAFESLKALFFR